MESISERQVKSWWILLLRGVAAAVFGVLALSMPGATILAMTLILGLWLMADGIIEIGYAFYSKSRRRILLGLLGLAVGIYAVVNPELGAYLLILSIGAWAIVRGVFDLIDAVKLRKRLANEPILILGALVSIVLGISLVVFPRAGGIVIMGLLGVYAVFYGCLTIADATRVRLTDPAFPDSDGQGHASERL